MRKSDQIEYKTWKSMRRRCNCAFGKDYADYGGRGIRICDRWDDYDNFLADMGPKPLGKFSLDRIDVNGNYEPSNCRWADDKTQANNRRNNRLVEINGVTKTVSQWAEHSGIKLRTIMGRLNRGVTGQDVLYDGNFSDKIYNVDGMNMKASELAKALGLSASVIAKRIKRNCPSGEITMSDISEIKKKGIMLTSNGITDNIKGWAKRLGISTASMHGRIRRNISREKIFHVGPLISRPL